MDRALMLATSTAIVGFARAASTDMPLAATFGIAMLAWFAWMESDKRAFLVTFYAFLALGMLAKGPVAPALAAVVIILFAVTQRSWTIVGKTFSLTGIAVFILIGLPWYALVQLRNPKFFRVFFIGHNLARFGTNMYHHPEPFWYYLPVTLLGWAPWTVFAVAAIVFAIRKVREPEADSLNTFLLIWVAVFVVFFSISQSKLPGYILPAIAPGILLLANYLREKLASRIPPAVIALHGLLVAALLFCALMLPSILLLHKFVWSGAAVLPLLVAVMAGAVVMLVLFRSGWSGLRLAGIAPAIVVFALALRFGAPALDRTLSARSVSEELATLTHAQLPVAVALVPRELEFGLQFYRNQPVPR